MLTSIIALVFLLLAASSIAVLFHRRIEECIPVSYTALICILSVFYCAGIIRIGMICICAAVIAGSIAALCRKKKLADYLSVLITPGSVVYAALCLVYVIFLSNNLVSRHDELRLWGAVPKAIYATGNLQLGWESPVFAIMQSYPPGQPMLSYFFAGFSAEFSEGALYVAYACASVSFFIPALVKLEWRNKAWMAPAGLLLLLTPMVFTSHFGDSGLFGMTLFVDPLLGILAGFCFYQASRKPFRSWFDAIVFSFSLAALCLLKSTGILFALAAVICAIVLDGFGNKKKYIVPAGFMAAAFGGWKLLLNAYDVHDLVPLKLHALSRQAISNVFYALTSENMVAYKVPLGILLSFSVLFPALLVILFFVKKQEKGGKMRANVILTAGLLLSTAAFIYGYALIYGETLESFPRYMASPLLAVATCILLSGLPIFSEEFVTNWMQRRKTATKAMISAVCIIGGIACFAVWHMVFPPFAATPMLDQEAERIRAAVRQDSGHNGSGWIYLVMAGDGVENSHFHHRIYFDLISKDVNIRNGYAQTQVVVPGLENPTEHWAEELRDGYEYVYLYSVEDALKPVFADLSEDTPEEKALYRVVKADTAFGVILERVH